MKYVPKFAATIRSPTATIRSLRPGVRDTAMSALALRTSDDKTLWHAGVGRVGNAPVTYELDGRQYVLIGGGAALYAFALPEPR